MTNLNEHSLRRRIVSEMHLRRWPELIAPCEIVQILRLIPADLRAPEAAALAAWPVNSGGERLKEQRHRSGQLSGDLAFTWERHTEASTITLFGSITGSSTLAEATTRAEQLPGEVLRAPRIYIFADEAAAQQKVDALGMEAADMVSCHSEEGARLCGHRCQHMP